MLINKYKNTYNLNSIILNFSILFLILITSVYTFKIYFNSISISSYAYNELFINYQFGFIRRGLLGQAFIFLNTNIDIEPILFFTSIFFILYVLQIVLFLKIFQNFFKSTFVLLVLLFSPVFILFNIYDPNIYYVKDIFIKVSILFHAFVFIEKKKNGNYSNYIKSLKFLIIPTIIAVSLIHEYQFFFVGVHFLISLGFCNSRKNFIYLLKIYSIILIPFILVIVFIGNESQYYELNNFLEKFNVKLHPQLKGGLYSAFGGFYKWHFYYFNYNQFVKLFLSFILGIIIFYYIFHKFMEKKIIKINSNYQKKYLLYFLPCLPIFILAHIDHGRNISLISTNLVAFYSTFYFNKKKYNDYILKFGVKFTKQVILLVFIIFYIFMWKLDQYAGYSMRDQNNMIFESSLFSEIKKLINFLYYYVDNNLFDLPDLNI